MIPANEHCLIHGGRHPCSTCDPYGAMLSARLDDIEARLITEGAVRTAVTEEAVRALGPLYEAIATLGSAINDQHPNWSAEGD